jgi:hypothetical protein
VSSNNNFCNQIIQLMISLNYERFFILFYGMGKSVLCLLITLYLDSDG